MGLTYFQRVTGKGDMLKTYKPCGIYANTPLGYMLLHMYITGLIRTSRTAPTGALCRSR
jgi:hypothetical protein